MAEIEVIKTTKKNRKAALTQAKKNKERPFYKLGSIIDLSDIEIRMKNKGKKTTFPLYVDEEGKKNVKKKMKAVKKRKKVEKVSEKVVKARKKAFKLAEKVANKEDYKPHDFKEVKIIEFGAKKGSKSFKRIRNKVPTFKRMK